VIGQIVHKALQMQVWQYPDERIGDILRAYAWEAYVTNRVDQAQVVDQALALIAQFKQHNPLMGADQIVREVPFLYRTGARIMHGVIDVVYRRGDTWTVLDYKTAAVEEQFVRQHSQRYLWQVSVYAGAVAERLGVRPRAQLYYLHPGVLISIGLEAWQTALRRLDQQVEAAITLP
jgi:ATP-dependent exoDNAse (exonuclease V) beta subunit